LRGEHSLSLFKVFESKGDNSSVIPAINSRSTFQVLENQILENQVLEEVEINLERDWLCVVWDDPVNLMSYVTHVFIVLFGFSRAKATELMMKVHNDGKAVVTSGSREEMERDVARLHEYGLWATIIRDDQSS
jgi:ATP-dependent Clp protease adaptor protein ClpS